MRALLQRVRNARVEVNDATIGKTGAGLLILICAMNGDTRGEAQKLALKIAKLRIFNDENGKMNRSLLDTGGGALVVSQFTLAADTSRGHRPGFSAAAPPDVAQSLYHMFAADLAELGVYVETGQFGADMAVSLVNDGPVTIWVEV